MPVSADEVAVLRAFLATEINEILSAAPAAAKAPRVSQAEVSINP
jgi:hypothetical protein